VFGYYSDELDKSYEAFYNELLKTSVVENATRSSRIPTGRLLDSNGAPLITKGDSLINATVTTKFVAIDEEFFRTYGMEMAAGRDLSKDFVNDDSLSFIVNETAAKAYGWTNVGDGIDKDFSYADIKGKLVGIVKDFHFESLHQSIVPIVFYSRPGIFSDLSIRISAGKTQEGLAHIEKVWREFLPDRPFNYAFVSEDYQRLYLEEQKQNQLFTIFSGLAIFIACLGLFGLHCLPRLVWVSYLQHAAAGKRNRHPQSTRRFGAQHFGFALQRNCDLDCSGQPDCVAAGLVLYAAMAK